MAGQITLLMLKHHNIINKYLSDFEAMKNESAKARKLFDAFQKILEKHIFIEEAYIFPVTDKNNSIEMLQLQNLMRDHKDVAGIVASIREELDDKIKPTTKILRELLFAHERREVESFYPRFDKRLSEEEKSQMIKKINASKFG